MNLFNAWLLKFNFNYYFHVFQVVIISGETGCGKTTQVPQFILESDIELFRGAVCNIICTQPRRIAAISVSERVASERGEKLGETVSFTKKILLVTVSSVIIFLLCSMLEFKVSIYSFFDFFGKGWI